MAADAAQPQDSRIAKEKKEEEEEVQHRDELHDNGVRSEQVNKEEEEKEEETEETEQGKEYAEERKRDLDGGKERVDQKFKALEYLLSQSKLYSTIMLSQMQRQEEEEAARDEKSKKRALKREETAEKAAEESQRRATRGTAAAATSTTDGEKESAAAVTASPSKPKNKTALPTRTRGGGGSKISDFMSKDDVQAKATSTAGTDVAAALEAEVDANNDNNKSNEDAGSAGATAAIGMQDLRSARQPALVTGGTMRSYQLEGLEWLISLYENGLNGILADEMGLGKTIQTIAFLAFLREKGTFGPFLIAAPLSTTTNWVDEIHKWTPEIPVVCYHGTKSERAAIRQKEMRRPGSERFPVVVTSYEICMNDRKFLAGFGWKFIIIDEGHRIKNLNCRLIRELQSYQSANRLLITGTPLQNNLTELWSLLHFLMPTVFDKLSSFESWFDFSGLKSRHGIEEILSEERQKKLVASLHAILKPFLLRRVKADVESAMPKKREYVLYAAMSDLQRELYAAIRDGKGREFLQERIMNTLRNKRDLKKKHEDTRTGRNQSNGTDKKKQQQQQQQKKRKSLLDYGYLTPNKSTRTSRDSTPGSQASFSTSTSATRRRAATRRRNYEEISDAQYFRRLEDGLENLESSSRRGSGFDSDEGQSSSAEEKEEEAMLAITKRHLQAKKLQNPLMQLRLCCNSPYNFYTPWDVCTDDNDDEDESSSSSSIHKDVAALTLPDESLVQTSGKMMILDELLPALFDGGHKVLIFSQFKTQLDLIETYARELREWPLCRIDGATPQEERHKMIKAFNEKDDNNDDDGNKKTKRNGSGANPSPSLFLLTTRAGGQGINLAAADTVILFDSDWNPAQDAQAQDRAHRIGQTRNVIVYRLATRGTVEQLVLESAGAKARLERLVVRKGGLVRGSAGSSGTGEEEKGKGVGRGKGRGQRKDGGVAINGLKDDEDDNADDDDDFKDLQRALGSVEGEMFDASVATDDDDNNDDEDDDVDPLSSSPLTPMSRSTRSTRSARSTKSKSSPAAAANLPDSKIETKATPKPKLKPKPKPEAKLKSKPIFSPHDLALLTDRSDEAYARAEAGLHNNNNSSRVKDSDGIDSVDGADGDQKSGSGNTRLGSGSRSGSGAATFKAVQGSLERKGAGGTEGLLGGL